MEIEPIYGSPEVSADGCDLLKESINDILSCLDKKIPEEITDGKLSLSFNILIGCFTVLLGKLDPSCHAKLCQSFHHLLRKNLEQFKEE